MMAAGFWKLALQLQHATVKGDLYRAQWVLQLKDREEKGRTFSPGPRTCWEPLALRKLSNNYKAVVLFSLVSFSPAAPLSYSQIFFSFFTWKLYEGPNSLVKIQKLLNTGGGVSGTKQQPRVKYTERERMLGPLFRFSSSSPGLRGLDELQRQIVAEAILLLQASTQQVRSTSQ